MTRVHHNALRAARIYSRFPSLRKTADKTTETTKSRTHDAVFRTSHASRLRVFVVQLRFCCMLLCMPAPKKPTKRSIAAKAKYEKDKVGRLHSIAERRAKTAGMSKKEYIAAIMKGEYRPITAEDIANKPDTPPKKKRPRMPRPNPNRKRRAKRKLKHRTRRPSVFGSTAGRSVPDAGSRPRFWRCRKKLDTAGEIVYRVPSLGPSEPRKADSRRVTCRFVILQPSARCLPSRDSSRRRAILGPRCWPLSTRVTGKVKTIRVRTGPDLKRRIQWARSYMSET